MYFSLLLFQRKLKQVWIGKGHVHFVRLPDVSVFGLNTKMQYALKSFELRDLCMVWRYTSHQTIPQVFFLWCGSFVGMPRPVTRPLSTTCNSYR